MTARLCFSGSSQKVGGSRKHEEVSLRDPIRGRGNLSQKPVMASAGDRHVAAPRDDTGTLESPIFP